VSEQEGEQAPRPRAKTRAEKVQETQAMIRRRKAAVAQIAMSGGDEHTVAELEAITRLETKLDNLEQLERLRALTREDDAGA
jgi:L-lysine 2,3-aminomutase